MGVLEDLVVLHPQRDERVDIEEPPVSEIAIRAAPPCQSVVLHVEQRVQCVRVGVHIGDDLIDGRGHEGIVFEQAPQLFAQHRLVTMASSHAGASVAVGRGVR